MAAEHHIEVRYNTIHNSQSASLILKNFDIQMRKKYFWDTGDVQYQIFANPRWRLTAMLDFKKLLLFRDGLIDFHET
jgi:hypothetical protein